MLDALVHSIAARRAEIEARIAAACARAGRDPADVTLVAVTKTHPAETVAAAYVAGLRHFGENRVQELAAKRPAVDALLGPNDAVWHLIGRLQSNKARDAVRFADAIHALDTLSAAEALVRRAEGAMVRVLVQVNVSGEAQKAGIALDETPRFLGSLAGLTGLRVEGLMAVATDVDDPERVRLEFRALRELRDVLTQITSAPLPILSMGMSGDFEVAVEEGATHVRVGSALFGARG